MDSQVGKGTTVSIILPSVDHDIASSIPVKVRSEVRQPGRILVMDDEEPIREALSAILADFGYDPISVRNGEEAIDAYRDAISEKRPFGVVIMDLTIRGGMGGKDAAQHILAMDPQAKMIVSSGYSNDPIMAHPEEYGFCDVLPKPFIIADLSAKLSVAISAKDSKERVHSQDQLVGGIPLTD